MKRHEVAFELRDNWAEDLQRLRDLEPSRELALAITKLEEARMWLGAAVYGKEKEE